jgi:formylglycine-generating enzyme required for sulfatase activity
MGCVPGDRNCRGNEHLRHEVELSRPYQLTATEITVGQFDAFARSTGGRTPRQPLWNSEGRYPVVNVTWDEAAAMCAWLGGRLPTEAEWERAARGGDDGRIFWWGDRFDRRFVNAGGSGPGDPWRTTAPVASFPPNGYGLHDMAGNVWEWVADWYARRFPRREVRDPAGPPSGTHRVIRGGSWDSSAARVRMSNRFGLPAGARYNLYVGFRCAR